MVEMCGSRSRATRLRHRRLWLGQQFVGSPEPRGGFGTLRPPRQGIWIELGREVLVEDQKEASSKEEDACLGRGLGTPVSVQAHARTVIPCRKNGSGRSRTRGGARSRRQSQRSPRC